jgi:transposase
MRMRERALGLFSASVPTQAVAAQLGISRQTAHAWRGQLAREGAASFVTRRGRGRPANLRPDQVAAVNAALLGGPARFGQKSSQWTIKGAASVIERLSGVEFGPSQVWRMLHALGLPLEHGHDQRLAAASHPEETT